MIIQTPERIIKDDELDLPIFNPYYWQVPSYNMLNDGFLRGIWVDHRRCGKDIRGFNLIIEEMWKNPGLYYYVFPSQTQGRKILWKGYTDPDRDGDGAGRQFLEEYLPKGIIHGKPNNTNMNFEMYTQGNRGLSTFQIIGTDQNRYEAMRGTNPRGAILSEQARQHPGAFEVLKPIFMKNKGWCIIQSTPNGNNHFKELYDLAIRNKNWFHCLHTVDHTYDQHNRRLITKAMIAEEIRMGMTEDFAQQEFYCSFMQGVEGTYVGRQMQQAEIDGRILSVPYDPSYLVDTYWDIGVGDFDSVWFVQQVGKEVRFIDYEEETGATWAYWTRKLKDKEYNYREHYAPFDIRDRNKAGDQEAAKSELSWAKDVGIEFRVTPDASFLNGCEALRGLLGRCCFDTERTAIGRRHLEMWGKVWNKQQERYTDFEARNEHTHAGASGRYTAINIRQAEGYDVSRTTEEKTFKRSYGRHSGGTAMSA